MGGGYREPFTSSIDFCEENHVYSHYVVELHNTWSSLLVSAFGILGLIQDPLQLWRVRIFFMLLVFTGIGSSLLHATLHWTWQSSDEIPMVYIMINLVYCLLELKTIHHRQWLANSAFGVAVCYTIIYYWLQDLYIVFLATFASISAFFSYQTFRLVRQPGRSQASIRVFQVTSTLYLAVASTCWIFDMLYCDLVLEYSIWGLTPHVIWHLCSGFGGYGSAMFLVCCRCEALKIPLVVHFWCGVIPLVSCDNGTKPSIQKKFNAGRKQS